MFLARVGRTDIAFEDELPEEPLWADFDRRLISQALTNVLKNAGEGIDARPPTSKARIRLELGADGEGARADRRPDNGKGFPNAERHKLLEPYVTTRAEGTGLGLPIVIKILEDHGGTVELLDGLERADGGRGAQVVMAFPLRHAAARRQVRRRRRKSRVEPMATDILIVDDEDDIRELVAGILEDEGHSHPRRRAIPTRRSPPSRRAGRIWCCSTSGCRARGSTACNCWK